MSKKGLGKFVVGAGIGAGLALLFAPKKGSETREDLKNLFNDCLDKIKTLDKDKVSKDIEKKIKEIKKDLADLDKEKVAKIVKAKSKEIAKKADELVDYAVEKGTPVLEKTAKEVKAKTAEVLKEMASKLEEPKKVTKK